MQIRRTLLPENSLIEKSFPKIDYSDSYTARFRSNQPIELKDCVALFLFNSPKWVNVLMDIRNVLVAPFGLKSDKQEPQGQSANSEIVIAKGSRIDFFDVLDFSDREVLFGMTDKLLDVCASVFLQHIHSHYEISLSTTVKYNNLMGKVYFFIIKPFHMLIVSNSLQRMINHYIIQ
jgi:hypothetical protein